MKRDARATFALIERIARVREGQAQQHLAQAIGQERTQRECVENTASQLHDADVALHRLQTRERLDVPRLTLYRELALSIDAALVREQDVLLDRCKARAARMGELARETHYRERVSERALDVTRQVQDAIDHRSADERLDAWLLRNASGDRK